MGTRAAGEDDRVDDARLRARRGRARHGDGQLRMTFGFTPLLQGFDFLIAVIGLFGLGEILHHDGGRARVQGQGRPHRSDDRAGRRGSCCRSTGRRRFARILIGCWMGITPGGATPASFMSYGMAKRLSKNGAKFGEGEIEGVIAPETAAHAAGTSALLPMLTLGIPGLADRGRAAGRPADLGPAAGAAAVRREAGLRLGPDRQHVPRQHRGADHRADDGAVVGGDPADSVRDHRAGHRRHLRDRRVHGPQQHVRRLYDGRVRRRSATCSRSSSTRSRRWCSRWCWATWPRRRSASRCCCRRAASAIFWSNPLVGSIVTLALVPARWPLTVARHQRVDAREKRRRAPVGAETSS